MSPHAYPQLAISAKANSVSYTHLDVYKRQEVFIKVVRGLESEAA